MTSLFFQKTHQNRTQPSSQTTFKPSWHHNTQTNKKAFSVVLRIHKFYIKNIEHTNKIKIYNVRIKEHLNSLTSCLIAINLENQEYRDLKHFKGYYIFWGKHSNDNISHFTVPSFRNSIYQKNSRISKHPDKPNST